MACIIENYRSNSSTECLIFDPGFRYKEIIRVGGGVYNYTIGVYIVYNRL